MAELELVSGGLPRFVRDYLYVDVSRTRSLLAQIDEGVIEKRTTETTEGQRREGRAGVTRANYLGKNSESVVREEYERAFHDSLFGHFEELAESCGLLVDISEQMQSEDAASVSGEIPAGTLVRITGPTCLFDSGYLRSSFKNIINVARGLSSLGGGDAPVVRTGQNKGQRPRQNGLGRARGGIEPDERDAMVSKMLDGMEPSSIGSLAEVVEGLFPDGIWAIQRLGPDRDVLISARCSATSEYLEKDRNALFSRYGVGYSQWTMVGLVGSRDSLVPETDLTITDTNGVLDRAKIVDVILGLMALIGATGFAEAPQGNNFAVTPLGIYRIVTPWAPSAARKPS